MKKLISLFCMVVLISTMLSAQSNPCDSFWTTPQGTYESRREAFLNFYSNYNVRHQLYSVFRQASRATAGLPTEKEGMQSVIDIIRSNHDCNDFTLNGLLRMVYLDKQQKYIPEEMKPDIKACILDFKYWWDDQRKDTTYRCYHTENHQALYHTAELLAGQLYKKEKFTNGMNGYQHIVHAKERLLPWLDNRFRFGFSEWMSTYYDVEVLLLTNLYDFAEDKVIRKKAGHVLNLLLFDLALNNYRGYLGSTSGRNYASSLLEGSHNTSPLTKLLFGVGTFDRDEAMGAVALATSSYRCPQVLCDIATDYATPLLNRQRISFNVEDAASYGIDSNNEIAAHAFWAMQEFIHPMTIQISKRISQQYDVWPYGNYDHYIQKYQKQIDEHGKLIQMHFDRFALSEANLTTFRTADYSLSSVADYRKGAPGYQQHIWMATLGNEALVYTNHPGGNDLRHSPNYWAGNEILPRAAQSRQVVVCIYRIPQNQKNRFTHAYFPVKAFDEVHLNGHWSFGRKGDGYVAIYSYIRPELQSDIRGKVCELKADGCQNVWVCEVGSKSQYGSFSCFIKQIMAANLTSNGDTVSYESPSEGRITFGWEDSFRVRGEEQKLRLEYRYDNPYCRAPFLSDRIIIRRNNQQLVIDYNN